MAIPLDLMRIYFHLYLMVPGVDASDGLVGFKEVVLNVVIAPAVVSVVSLIITLTSTILHPSVHIKWRAIIQMI